MAAATTLIPRAGDRVRVSYGRPNDDIRIVAQVCHAGCVGTRQPHYHKAPPHYGIDTFDWITEILPSATTTTPSPESHKVREQKGHNGLDEETPKMNLIDEYKRLTRSKDEKLLIEVGIRDETGALTSDGEDLLLDIISREDHYAGELLSRAQLIKADREKRTKNCK